VAALAGPATTKLMPAYYIYTLDDNGHIERRIDAICSNDEQAKRRAEQLLDGHVLELWLGARKIAEFKPENYGPFRDGHQT
jgi:hypothetical protein